MLEGLSDCKYTYEATTWLQLVFNLTVRFLTMEPWDWKQSNWKAEIVKD